MSDEITRLTSRAIATAIGSVAGLGFVPQGSATVGAAAGAAAVFLLRPRLSRRLVMAGAAAGIGQACAAQLHDGANADPDYLIIDEVAGVWLALSLIPPGRVSWLAGAVVFRILDKVKPGPIGELDRAEGVWSLMGDDLIAGLAAGLLVNAGRRLCA